MTNITMTPKQQRFVQEYLVDLNATQAAVRAGYSEKTARSQGQRLLTNVDIAMAIEVGQAKRSERTEVTQDYVLNSIVETIERCKQAEPVKYQNGEPVFIDTPDGDVARAYKFNATAVLKGLELLGRHLAMFTDKVETRDAFAHMSDEEIEARIVELEQNRLPGRTH